MKVVLVLLELALLLVLQAQSKISLKEYFDVEKLAGKWRTLAIASDSEWIEDLRKNGKMSTSTVEPQSTGEIIIKTFIPGPAGCKQRTMVLKKTDHPGQYTNSGSSGPWSSDDDLKQRSDVSHKSEKNLDDCGLIDTDYTSYTIVLGHRHYNGQKISVLLLYSRNTEVKPGVLEKFNDTIKEAGLSKEQMVMLPKAKECRPQLA
nr:PREDICTED: lipocalin-like [Apteryx mantelli mantelli]